MCNCPTAGSPGCSDPCSSLSKDPMSNGVFRVCTKDLNIVSDGYISLIFLISIDVPSLIFIYSVFVENLFSLVCSVSFSALLLCFAFPYFLPFPPLFNPFVVSGDWQQWDLTQGGASGKKKHSKMSFPFTASLESLL